MCVYNRWEKKKKKRSNLKIHHISWRYVKYDLFAIRMSGNRWREIIKCHFSLEIINRATVRRRIEYFFIIITTIVPRNTRFGSCSRREKLTFTHEPGSRQKLLDSCFLEAFKTVVRSLLIYPSDTIDIYTGK